MTSKEIEIINKISKLDTSWIAQKNSIYLAE